MKNLLNTAELEIQTSKQRLPDYYFFKHKEKKAQMSRN